MINYFLRIYAVILLLSIAANALGAEEEGGTACVEGDCKNGRGKLATKDGKGVMEGDFWEGKLIQGRISFPNGEVHEGFFRDDHLAQGTKRFPNGMVMQGKFEDNVLVSGAITYPDGRTFPIQPHAQKKAPKMIPIPKDLLPSSP